MPPQATWTSPPAAVEFRSLAEEATLSSASWETQCLNLFSADFCSCLVARSRKPIKCVLKTLLRRSMHAVPNTNSSAKSQQFLLQFPTVTPLLTRLWLSIQFTYTRALQIFGRRPQTLLHNSSKANILRNMIFSGYVTFYQISNFFVNTVFFHYWQNVFCSWMRQLLRSDLARGPKFDIDY